MTSSILGTWRLVSWYNELDDGTKVYPLGPDATGFINYSTDGYVFVQMMAANRSQYTINDPFGGSDQEDTAAIKSQIAYSGQFHQTVGRVVHNVRGRNLPKLGWDQAGQKCNVSE